MTSTRPQTRLAVGVAVIIAGALLALYALLHIPALTVPLLVSLALFHVLDPLLEAWERRGHRRGTGLLIIAGAFLAFAIGLALQLPVWLSRQWTLVQERAPMAGERIVEWTDAVQAALVREVPQLSFLEVGEPLDAVLTHLQDAWLPLLPQWAFQTVLGTLLVPVFTYFLLRDGRGARKAITRWVPNRHFEMTLNVLYRIGRQTGAYLRGVMVEAALVGLVAYAFLVILSVPGAPFIAAVVAVTNIIPYLGPVTGGITGIAYLVLLGAPPDAIWGVLLAVAVAQLADNLVIGPNVLGRAVNVHPLTVLVLLLLGGRLFGLVGLLIAVPVWVVLRVLLQETVRAVNAYGRYMVDPPRSP